MASGALLHSAQLACADPDMIAGVPQSWATDDRGAKSRNGEPTRANQCGGTGLSSPSGCAKFDQLFVVGEARRADGPGPNTLRWKLGGASKVPDAGPSLQNSSFGIPTNAAARITLRISTSEWSALEFEGFGRSCYAVRSIPYLRASRVKGGHRQTASPTPKRANVIYALSIPSSRVQWGPSD